MQQKLAIACALIADPPILLLDEPTLGLDIQAARTVKVWVQHLAQKQGKTIVLTTHQLDLAEALCERIIILRRGEVVADQPTAALLERFRQEYYEILVEGQFSPADILLRFEDFAVSTENDHTLLRGPIAGQRELHQLLNTIHAQGLILVSVQRARPKLEEVFMTLLEDKESSHGQLAPV
jgi:ABC-2 type transport system ATP-binding protein